MRLGVYCRVSTDKLDQLNSLETQKMFFEEFAEKNNHTLVKIYADEGISGTQLKKRTEFLEMMHDAELGKFDMVVTKDVSRMARNVLDFLQSIRKLKSMGIPVLFVTAMCDAHTVMTCRRLHAAGYIVRPYKAIYIKSEVERIFSGWR